MQSFKDFMDEEVKYTTREGGQTTTVEKNKFDLNAHTVIGWLSNKENPAFGWSIHRLTPAEKKEFGATNTYRALSGKNGDNTSIIKIDPSTGKYAFIDNKAYEDGKIKYDRMAKYKSFVVDKKLV
jgi:hypothetical protein